jgi:hypothetical protein
MPEDVERTPAELGEMSIGWLRGLPQRWHGTEITVVHAGPDDRWTASGVRATDAALTEIY